PAPHRLGVIAPGERMFRRVTDQAGRVAKPLHHLIAAVDTCGAADALILQALADVDPGGANLHTDVAVDAVAQSEVLALDRLGPRAARFATVTVVGDSQRIRV